MKKILILLAPLLFFLISLYTLKDYGISWDEPIHFHRGQAYLNYFLTGQVRFDSASKASYYENNNLPAEYWLEKDDGHPPLNGILASLSNLIFYQKLGILGDIESYHLFNIVTSTMLVLIVVLFAYQTYGVFAALVAGLVVSTYPLFFAESHFNIKDPPQAAFFTLTIWAFWKSLQKGSWKWLLFSAVSAGFALGIKFNILFLPLIILPYIFARYRNNLKITKAYLLALFASPFIVFGIFFATWPFLWQDPLVNIPKSLVWYQDIGTGKATFGYFFKGINLYAPLWILWTTPPLVLALSLIGTLVAVKRIKEHGFAPLLWLLWFSIPILRVVAPSTTIYGGVRQIMEFLPAMALLAGLGADQMVIWSNGYMVKWFPRLSSHLAMQLLVILAFVWPIFILIKLHPNQNVYFNNFIGGLAGAARANVPYHGNSFGNAYLQAIEWINSNAEENAKFALIQGTGLNIPRPQLRSDLRFSNSFWSGIYRDGEYLVELTHHDKRVYPYAWEYAEGMLDPVYEVKVDGVAIAKVWKNDLEHTKPEFRRREVVLAEYSKDITSKEVILDLGREAELTRLVILYKNQDCEKPRARVSTSPDSKEWLYRDASDLIYDPEEIPVEQIVYREKEETPFEAFFFSGRRARFIKLEAYSLGSCLLKDNVRFKVYILEDLR